MIYGLTKYVKLFKLQIIYIPIVYTRAEVFGFKIRHSAFHLLVFVHDAYVLYTYFVIILLYKGKIV